MSSNIYRTRWKILICIILAVHERAPAHARVMFYWRYIYCKLITYNAQMYWRESTISVMHVLEEQLIFDLLMKTIPIPFRKIRQCIRKFIALRKKRNSLKVITVNTILTKINLFIKLILFNLKRTCRHDDQNIWSWYNILAPEVVR